MLIIFPKSDSSGVEPTIEQVIQKLESSARPPDWAFMQQSEKVLNNIPTTWQQYPQTRQGKMNIIDMEYTELVNADTVEARKHELIHLASACLYLWRDLEGI